MTSVRGITGEARAEKMVAAAFVFFLSGIGFFQPLLLLINAQADAVPALVVQGKGNCTPPMRWRRHWPA
jgi:hypothetical protein